ncbi:putative E3 ubiquitin-protein ligase ARI8 [Pseudocercospora fuligena]|uniref:Putative E3 ubiquitin-protein ligase ARI8 n=1 Tax=Pseudocercospora fuligena TaxID=685502 RepID=A0A8H6RBE6_9PEZI|nr:putative E3 ubiquitin-protein ligase ARI8 [Pseudocercospora fuligena]
MDVWARVLDDADPETARLILSLQQEDIEALAPAAAQTTTSVTPDGGVNDGEVARHLYANELRNELAIRDLITDRPESDAATGDGPLEPTDEPSSSAPETHQPIDDSGLMADSSEPDAAPDDGLATQGEEGSRLQPQSTRSSPLRRPTTSGPLLGKRAREDEVDGNAPKRHQSIADGSNTQKTALTSALGKRSHDGDDEPEAKRQKRPRWLTCCACHDKEIRPRMSGGKLKEKFHQAACDHVYCDDCLEQLFRHSMADPQLYPPRCCRILIPISDVNHLLSSQLSQEFTNKTEELQDRTPQYCHRPECSAYLPDWCRDDGKGICPSCLEDTCLKCKGASHEDPICPEDEETKMVLEEAKKAGWKQCKECDRMIELTFGCWHMTCLCSHEFCFICKKTWKTCKCERWDEARLYERAEEIVAREGGDVNTIFQEAQAASQAAREAALEEPAGFTAMDIAQQVTANPFRITGSTSIAAPAATWIFAISVWQASTRGFVEALSLTAML